jgi:hypothetical protein
MKDKEYIYNFCKSSIKMHEHWIERQLRMLHENQKNGIQLQNKQLWKNINKENWNNGRRANVHRKNRVKYR